MPMDAVIPKHVLGDYCLPHNISFLVCYLMTQTVIMRMKEFLQAENLCLYIVGTQLKVAPSL